MHGEGNKDHPNTELVPHIFLHTEPVQDIMKRPKNPTETTNSLSIEAASKLIGHDRRVVTKAIEGAVEIEPTGYHGGNARYSLRDVVAALIDYKVNAVRNHGGDAEPDELDRQRTRLTRAKADMAEMQSALFKGRSLDAGAVEAVWIDHLLACRQKLLALPRRLAARLHGEGTPAAIERVLEVTIHEALSELAEYDPQPIVERYLSQAQVAAITDDDDAPAASKSTD